MKTALVTGGAGFIGSRLVKKLIKEKYSVTVADDLSRGRKENLSRGIQHEIVDLTRPALCESVFSMRQFDEIYHLAAFMGGVKLMYKFPVEGFTRNMKMSLNVLDCCLAWEVPKVLFTSSACLYPASRQSTPDSPPLKEVDAFPPGPDSGYGWAKLMTELLCKSYIEGYGMKIAIARLFNVYGPREPYDDYSHVIPTLCRKAINFPRERFLVWGDGTQTRSFIYVDDAVDGIIRTMKYGLNKGPYNIGTPDRVTISYLAELIADLAMIRHRKDIEIEYDLSKPMGVIGRSADNQKSYKELGWQPSVNLGKGIAETMIWIEKDLEEKLKKAHVKSG